MSRVRARAQVDAGVGVWSSAGMDLSGRWEFAFDRNLNGQLVPTTPPYELILISLDETTFVGRFVFPADDRSKFRGDLTRTSQGTLMALRQVNEQTGYQALYIGKVEVETKIAGIFTDLAGPDGDFRMRKIR
jgi:hypothetical protein